MKYQKKYYTKDEIRMIINLWEGYTIQELAKKLDRSNSSVLYMAKKIRDNGYGLSKKMKKYTVDSLIKEVLKELNLQ